MRLCFLSFGFNKVPCAVTGNPASGTLLFATGRWFSSYGKFKCSQKIFLQKNHSVTPSIEVAADLRKSVCTKMNEKIESGEDSKEKPNISIVWGEGKSGSSGNSDFYLVVEGSGNSPIERNPELNAVMQYAISQVNIEIGKHK